MHFVITNGKKKIALPCFFSNKLSIKQSLLAVWGKNPHFFSVEKNQIQCISIYFILQVINYDKNKNFCPVLLSRKVFLSCLHMLSAQRLLLRLWRVTNNQNRQETHSVPARWLELVDIHNGIGRAALTTHPALHKLSSEIKTSCIGYKKNWERHKKKITVKGKSHTVCLIMTEQRDLRAQVVPREIFTPF